MSEMLSVRRWQDLFRSGAFQDRSRETQIRTRWYDWFCSDTALAGRLQRIGRVVMGITEPAILDNYYVWFKNNCPLDGPIYDDVRFEPLGGDRCGRYFVVSQDCPYYRAIQQGFEANGLSVESLEEAWNRTIDEVWSGKVDRPQKRNKVKPKGQER